MRSSVTPKSDAQHTEPTAKATADGIQAKLEVSAPEDALEREADLVADRILHMPPRPAPPGPPDVPGTGTVQRAATKEAMPAEEDEEGGEIQRREMEEEADGGELQRRETEEENDDGEVQRRMVDEEDGEIQRRGEEEGRADALRAPLDSGVLSRGCAECDEDAEGGGEIQRREAEVENEGSGEIQRAVDAPLFRVCAECDEHAEEGGEIQRRAMDEEDEDGGEIQRVAGAPLFRVCAECEEQDVQRAEDEEDDDTAMRDSDGRRTPILSINFTRQLRSARSRRGEPLPGEVRRFMEPRFGRSFDGVRVHRDAEAAGLAERARAKAFTIGRDIFFGKDAFRPGTTHGRHLLAHELTHVLQQQGGLHSVRRDVLEQHAVRGTDDGLPQIDERSHVESAQETTESAVLHASSEPSERQSEDPSAAAALQRVAAASTIATDGATEEDDSTPTHFVHPSHNTGHGPARVPASHPAEREADERGARIADDLPHLGGSSSGPLPKTIRDVAERHLDIDLSGARLDAGIAGQLRAGEHNALAVTQDSTINFAPGRLETVSREGRELLGHELTHIAQQRAHNVSRAPQRRSEGEASEDEVVVPDVSDISDPQEISGREAERELDAKSVQPEPPVDPATPAGGAEPEAPEPATAIDDVGDAEPPVTPEETPEAEDEVEREPPAAPEAALEPLLVSSETPAVVAQAAASLVSMADAEIGAIRSTAADARASISESIQAAREAIDQVVAARREAIRAEYGARRATATQQAQSAAAEAASSFDATKEEIRTESDAEERARGRGETASTAIKGQVDQKQGEKEQKTADNSGKSGGLTSMVRSAVVVKIGAEIGKRIIDAGKEALDVAGSLLDDAMSIATDFGAEVTTTLTDAFGNVTALFPDVLGDFVSNLQRGESETISQLAALQAQSHDRLGNMKADMLESVTQSEAEGVVTVESVYVQAAGVLEQFDFQPNETDEETIEAQASGVDALVQETSAVMASTRAATEQLMGETVSTVQSEAIMAPERFAAEVDKVVAAGESSLRNAAARFLEGLTSLISTAVAALDDVTTGVAKSIGDLLEGLGGKLEELGTLLSDWASNVISNLGRAFGEGIRLALAWLNDKLSISSLFDFAQTKQEVIQRGFLSIAGAALSAAWNKLLQLGMIIALAGFAVIAAALVAGPIGAAAALGAIAVLLIGGLIAHAVNVIQRLDKGGLPALAVVIAFGPAFVFELIGIFPIMSGILGEDVLSGKKLETDEKRGEQIGSGAVDFLTTFVVVGRLGSLVAKGFGKAGGFLAKTFPRTAARIQQVLKRPAGLLEKGRRLLDELSELARRRDKAAPEPAGPDVPVAAKGGGLGLRPPAGRHTLRSVKQGTVAKNVNTVVEPGVDVAGDVAAINQGLAKRVGDTFEINGRVYGVHDGTLFPVSGPGFHQLNRGAFQALGVLNKFGDTPQAHAILGKMKNVGPDEVAAALRAWRAGQ